MPGNTVATVYVGNLDERVDERILYEIMVQAGPLVDVFIPRDKESKRHKGYGFAEYATERNAQYAVSLFTGLVSIYNRSIRIAISGQDKPVQASEGKDTMPSKNLDNKPVQALEVKDKVLIKHLDDHNYSQRKPLRSCYSQWNSPPPRPTSNKSLMSAKTSYSGPTLPGHGQISANLAHVQNYNAHLVSLGQHGLRIQVPTHGYSQLRTFY